ncbi:MAG: arylesterase [Burkholderiaceae bacterium]
MNHPNKQFYIPGNMAGLHRGIMVRLRMIGTIGTIGTFPTLLLALCLSLAAFTPSIVNGAQSNGKSGEKTLLVLGDSLSAEYGITRGSGWVALLGKRLQDAGLPHKIVNASISGETTAGGRTRIDNLLKRHSPSTVVVELGANDALRGLDLARTQENLSVIVGAARATGANVLLLGMQVPPNYGKNYVRQFSEIFVKVANEHKAALVPFWFKELATDMTKFQADGIHPNQQAQSILLDSLWPQLSPLLSSPPKKR